MNEAARIRVSAATPTPKENLGYTLQMLKELRPKAEGVDWMLTHLIDMTITHAHDLLTGAERMERAPKSIIPPRE